MFRKIDAGEIKGLLSICFNPKVSLPDNSFVTRALEKLEFYVAIDFFLNDTARHADIVLPGQPAGGGRRRRSRRSKGASSRSTRRSTAPARRGRTGASSRTSPARWAGRTASRSTSPREIFEELRVASKGGVADYSGITYEKIERQMGVFWPCYSRRSQDRRAASRPPRHAAAVRAGQLQPGRQGRRAVLLPRRQGPLQRRRLPPPAEDDASDEYPLFLTTGRVVSQFLSGTQTRRIGPLVDQYPEPRIEMHPRLAEKLGIADGDWATAETRRGAITLARHGRDDDPPRHGLHPLPLGRAKERQPADRRRAGPDQQDPPVQGVRLPRAQGRRRRRSTPRQLEPQQ